uniref:(northern house mosquito) hypothetical protein n=1 Tax=Culex pipiens TaxID=7175 RepID=A0A8D8F208_CULPI
MLKLVKKDFFSVSPNKYWLDFKMLKMKAIEIFCSFLLKITVKFEDKYLLFKWAKTTFFCIFKIWAKKCGNLANYLDFQFEFGKGEYFLKYSGLSDCRSSRYQYRSSCQ